MNSTIRTEKDFNEAEKILDEFCETLKNFWKMYPSSKVDGSFDVSDENIRRIKEKMRSIIQTKDIDNEINRSLDASCKKLQEAKEIAHHTNKIYTEQNKRIAELCDSVSDIQDGMQAADSMDGDIDNAIMEFIKTHNLGEEFITFMDERFLGGGKTLKKTD